MAKKKPARKANKPSQRQNAANKARRLKQSHYKTFRLSKRIRPNKTKKLTSSYRLLSRSIKLIWRNWKLFLTISAIYGLLSILFVHGIGGGLKLNDIKASLKSGVNGQPSELTTGTLLFSYLVGSSGGSASQTAGTYQSLLVILMSLVIIWALRQVIAGHAIRARDAFYKGTYPFVQFVLVLVVIGLQLLPLLIGGWIYSAVNNNGIAVTGPEKFIWFVLFALLAMLSLYMVSSSIFALYIATLPDMTPLKALRSARALVLHRRWTVLRKVIFLPFAIMVIGAVIMIPLILILTPIAEWIFFGLSMVALVVVHSYMYSLYRDLL